MSCVVSPTKPTQLFDSKGIPFALPCAGLSGAKKAGELVHVLAVDDDPDMRELLEVLLAGAGISVTGVTTADEALRVLEEQPVDLVLTDLVMPEVDGITLLRRVRASHPALPVILMTAQRSVEPAVEAMKAGAADFILKPLDAEELLFAVKKGATACRYLEQRHVSPGAPGKLIGESQKMQACYELIRKAARGDATVLLRGESGTGKELAARAIHQVSARRDQPFVKVHCAALPDNLLESELFGYEKGAFTGAVQRKPGRVGLAQGGTLFLDEIGDITPAIQVKLLRLLQDREYERLGGTETLAANVRFVAATHRDLETMVSDGSFREDLFYRLNVIPITLPPLRERLDDVPVLTHHFRNVLGEAHGVPQLELEEGVVEALAAHAWPGNVRQLVNLVERLVVLSDGVIVRVADVARELAITAPPMGDAGEPTTASVETAGKLKEQRHEAEKDAILQALAKANNNRTLTARILGVSRRTLYNKLKSYDLLEAKPS